MEAGRRRRPLAPRRGTLSLTAEQAARAACVRLARTEINTCNLVAMQDNDTELRAGTSTCRQASALSPAETFPGVPWHPGAL